ncbi:MAG: YdeI/OmpD-associated family protein [Clostridiales bacterium]|nr:YdeI/OmpD-associated family protein [Clostridiales bacterium]
MDPMRELPLGFGMALCANPAAMAYFERQSPARQRAILERTHSIRSSKEMKAFVAGLGQE